MEQRQREAFIAQTSFSLRLSTHLINVAGSTGSNLAFSPLSIHSLLSLLTTGCTGPTHRHLLSFLGSPNASHLTTLYSQLSSVLLVDGSSVGGPRLCYAGGVWVDAGTNLKNSFREVANSVFKAEAHPVPFQYMPEESRNQINKWVEEVTAGHIKDLLPPQSIIESTRLVLGNAIYFKGSWDTKFESRYTTTNSFRLIDGSSVETHFMASEKAQFISAYDGFKVLKLPYEQGQDFRQFSFYIFLPDTINGLPDLAMKLITESDFLKNHIPERKVPVRNFRIPKFKISMRISFAEILRSLGLELPFKMTGDFSGMVDSVEVSNYYVSHIVHKCFVEVNEEGTEAAAASAAVMTFGCSMSIEEPIDFVADHPFLFLIQEDRTSVVLFVGHLLNPLLAG